jgi:hypothetical protein
MWTPGMGWETALLSTQIIATLELDKCFILYVAEEQSMTVVLIQKFGEIPWTVA